VTPSPPPDHGRAQALARATEQAFEERFANRAEWLVAAPGRVNLIGEHTDYSGGFVLPMAIERFTVIAGAAGPSGVASRLQLYSAALNASVDVPLDSPQRPGEPSWSNYVRGVVSGFERRGVRIPSLRAIAVSDVPLGCGLSSSAALSVALATLLETVTAATLDPVEKARLCQTAEQEFAGVPCGLMDPLICILGERTGPLLIDCRSALARAVSLRNPAVSILIVDSEVRHSLGDGAYAQRRADCESAARLLDLPSLRDATPEMVDAAQGALGPVLQRRARHVVSENARTLEAAAALDEGAFEKVGSLMFESHRSLRDDYEVSCEELDVLVDAARELGQAGGIYGARMTGGGFGGCAVALVKTSHIDAVSRHLQQRYERRTGRRMTAFVSRPARGAHVVTSADLATDR
jgi:galactokinase